MTAVVRPMRWWDVAAVHDLEQQLFDDPWTAEQLWSELAAVPDRCWYAVADDAGTVVGYAGLSSVPPEADVQTVAVAPDRHGEGLGGVLLDALLAEAARRGATQVFLEVRTDNPAAIALYEGRGFERIAVRHGYYGPGQDAAVMRRRSREGAS